jgi:hypothetical protein
MQLSFAHNIREVERDLSDLARRQLPFATSLALNETAQAVEREAAADLERRLDRPTPFTRRGLLVLRSSKARLWADVLFKDLQAAYLRWQEGGGTRNPKGRAIPVPVALPVNAFGNMPRGAVKRAAGRADVFSGRPGGGRLPPGLYQRLKGGGLRMLVAFEPRADYEPRLDFEASAERTARAFFPPAFERALRRAIAWAR